MSNETGGDVLTDINNMSLQAEEMPSLADFGREPSSGSWPDGWYESTILPGYSSGNSNYQWQTEDTVSKNGDSRNMRVCFALKNKSGETRNYWASFNYRLADFTPERLGAIAKVRKQAQAENWKSWPGELKDLQRSSLAIGQLGQFERALGFKLKLLPGGGGLNTSIFPGQKLDVRLRLNSETGYSDVVEYAKAFERKALYK